MSERKRNTEKYTHFYCYFIDCQMNQSTDDEKSGKITTEIVKNTLTV